MINVPPGSPQRAGTRPVRTLLVTSFNAGISLQALMALLGHASAEHACPKELESMPDRALITARKPSVLSTASVVDHNMGSYASDSQPESGVRLPISSGRLTSDVNSGYER